MVAEVVGTSFLKSARDFTWQWPSLGAVVVRYSLALHYLSMTLRTLPIGIANAVWTGIGIVLIALIGRLVFAQRLGTEAMVGIGLIIAGVMMINVFSRSVQH